MLRGSGPASSSPSFMGGEPDSTRAAQAQTRRRPCDAAGRLPFVIPCAESRRAARGEGCRSAYTTTRPASATAWPPSWRGTHRLRSRRCLRRTAFPVRCCRWGLPVRSRRRGRSAPGRRAGRRDRDWWAGYRSPGRAAVAARDTANLERSKAEQEASKAESVKKFLQRMLASVDSQTARGRDTTLLREILENAARRVESELADQPAVAAPTVLARRRARGHARDAGRRSASRAKAGPHFG